MTTPDEWKTVNCWHCGGILGKFRASSVTPLTQVLYIEMQCPACKNEVLLYLGNMQDGATVQTGFDR